MKNYEGFGFQGLTGRCGIYSIKHALLLCGVPTIQSSLIKRAGFNGMGFKDIVVKNKLNIKKAFENWGTSDSGIKKALRYYKINYKLIYTDDENVFLRKVDRALSKGNPIIVSVGNFDHWSVLGGKYSNKYLVIDSSGDELFDLYTTSEVIDYCYNETDSNKVKSYYGIELTSKVKNNSLMHVKSLVNKVSSDETLLSWWGYYLALLKYYFSFNRNKKNSMISISEALRAGKKSLIRYIKEAYGCSKKEIAYEIDNLILVAEAYSFQAPGSQENYIFEYLVEILEFCLDPEIN